MSSICRLLRYGLFPAIVLLVSGCLGGGPAVIRSNAQQRADSLVARAIKLDQKGNAKDAVQLLNEALTVSTSIEDQPSMTRILINRARIQRREQELANAQRSIEHALQSCPPGSAYRAEAAQEQSMILLSAGTPRQALAWAEKAVSWEQGTDKGRRLNLLARINLILHDRTSAGNNARVALRENRAAGADEEEANSLRILGVIARDSGDHGQSKLLLNDALAIDKRIGTSGKIAADLDELAQTSRAAGELDAATRYQERANAVRSATAHLSPARPGTAQNAPDTTSPSSKP